MCSTGTVQVVIRVIAQVRRTGLLQVLKARLQARYLPTAVRVRSVFSAIIVLRALASHKHVDGRFMRSFILVDSSLEGGRWPRLLTVCFRAVNPSPWLYSHCGSYCTLPQKTELSNCTSYKCWIVQQQQVDDIQARLVFNRGLHEWK